MARRKKREVDINANRNASLRLRASTSAPSGLSRWWPPFAHARRYRRRLIAGLVLAIILFWMSASGAFDSIENRIADKFYRATTSLGLRVEEVYVTGRRHAGADEINGALDIRRGQPILSVDIAAAHKALLDIPWIARARIERHLPNVIYVEIVERVPYARWQNQKQVSLVDREGVVLTRDNADAYSSLPLVVGAGAGIHAADILDELQATPDFARSLKAAIRVSDRRWDIRLQNGMTLRLPELGMAEALQRVENLWRTTDIATRGMKVIDARLPDRIIVDEAKDTKPDGEQAEAPL